MSGHEQERLSAFLDDELAPSERAAVEQHLAVCAECQARLGELAAADRAAASLPAEPPAGYFESFPGRVRARLDGRKPSRGLPRWSWAVAAVLLLAVVTPLTLSRRPGPEPLAKEQATSPTVAQAPPPPAAAAPAAGVAAPQTAAPLERAYRERAEKKAEAPALRRPAAPEPAPLAARRDGFATAPGEADAREAVAATRPLEPQANAPAREAVVSEEEAARKLDEVAPAGQGVGGLEGRSQAKRTRDALASTAQPKDDADAAGEAGLGRARAGAAAASAPAAPRPVAAEDEWQRLDSTRPGTAAEWRELREAWRHYAASRPDGARADEARVRVVEAGREAWRASGEPADEDVFRRDAAGYLARADATQPERVRRLLR